jgi:hypothetical protein
VLQDASVQSPTFRAEVNGTITLASVLSNSPVELPVKVYLDRAVAQTINLVPPDAPTNANYVKLPDFYAVKGTLGDPKPEINKMALLGTALRGVSGLAGKNSGLLQGLGNALTGGSSGTNAASTNQAAGKGGLLQGLGGLLGGGATASTNAPPGASTNPPATNTSPVGNLLNNLLKPRKQ